MEILREMAKRKTGGCELRTQCSDGNDFTPKNSVRGAENTYSEDNQPICGACLFARGMLCILVILTSLIIFSVKHGFAFVAIQSSVDGGPWAKNTAIYPLKKQKIVLKADRVPGGEIKWYRIVPDISKNYKNANYPWDKDPYQWLGLTKIDYYRTELTQFRGNWEIEPFNNENKNGLWDKILSWCDSSPGIPAGSEYYHHDVGSFWFQVEIEKEGTVIKSPGIEESDNKGLSPSVFRVSIRDGEGYLGYLTSFFNVPGLFGSVPYQSNNYIGVDCADVLMAAYGKWKNAPIEKNYNVAMLVSTLPKIDEFNLVNGTPDKTVKWGKDIRPGDLIAVAYSGRRQYQHIGALFSDTNNNGILDSSDQIIHAGPYPLHYSRIKERCFEGHVVILRP